MRRPTRRTPSRGQRTPSRGQRSPRRPTPLPSRPVRGRPKGPPVRGVPKNPPRPRPVRGGRRITDPPRPVRGGPKTPPKPPGGRVPKRVKEPLTPIKKTLPNTGNSTRTPQRVPTKAEQTAMMEERIRRSVGSKPTTGGQTKKTPPATGTSTKTAQLQKRAQLDAVPVKGSISQRQPTAAERKQMEAALRASEGVKPATPAKSAKGKFGFGNPQQEKRFGQILNEQTMFEKGLQEKYKGQRNAQLTPSEKRKAISFGVRRARMDLQRPDISARDKQNIMNSIIRMQQEMGKLGTPARGRGGSRTTGRRIKPTTPTPPRPKPRPPAGLGTGPTRTRPVTRPRPTTRPTRPTRPRSRPSNSSSSRRTQRSRFMGR